jgi:putative endonuclease
MRHRPFAVYILTTRRHTALYIGVTSDLERRLAEHRGRTHRGFTRRYGATKLVYVEWFAEPRAAIAREKQLKAGSRAGKITVIERENPAWRELWPAGSGP